MSLLLDNANEVFYNIGLVENNKRPIINFFIIGLLHPDSWAKNWMEIYILYTYGNRKNYNLIYISFKIRVVIKQQLFFYSFNAACAAASLAIGTLNGEQET